jgi:hypothetical protein
LRESTGESEAASARYQDVNPKPLADMEFAADVMVEEPIDKYSPANTRLFNREVATGRMDLEEYERSLAKFSERTHFPTRKNVIGFARTYVETLPDGTKALHVFEVQSDWAAAESRREERLSAPGAMPMQSDMGATDRANPYLGAFESLALKAAIKRAQSLGITQLVISDAETAMMTEQHDGVLNLNANRDVNSGKKGPILVGEVGVRYPNGKIRVFDTQDDAEAYAARDTWSDSSERKRVDRVTPQDLVPLRPKQEPGMRAAYDPKIGSTHARMRKMTGDNGKPVDMGLHNNSFPSDSRAGLFTVVNRAGDVIEDAFETEDAAREFADQTNRYDRNAADGPFQFKLRAGVGSRVFKNADGTPKTNITGIVYDLTNVNPEEVSTLGTKGVYTTSSEPIFHEPGRHYVYLRDAEGDLMAVRQVDTQDVDETKDALQRDALKIAAEVFRKMVAGEVPALGTKVARSTRIVELLTNGSGFQSFVKDVQTGIDPTAEPFSFVHPTTGDYSIGALVRSPNWRQQFETAAKEHGRGSVQQNLIKLLLSYDRFDEVMSNRPLYVESMRQSTSDEEMAWGLAFDERRSVADKNDIEWAAVQAITSLSDTASATSRPPAFVLLPPSHESFDAVLLHEGVHLLTQDLVEYDSGFNREVSELMKYARKKLGHTSPKPDGSWEVYGLTNVHEFLAETFSNPEFSGMLNSLPAKTSPLGNVLRDIMEVISKYLFGDPKHASLLSETVARVYKSLDTYGAVVASARDEKHTSDRLVDFIKGSAPHMAVDNVGFVDRLSVQPGPLKARAIQKMGSDMLLIDSSLIKDPGKAERLIVEENAYAKFRKDLHPDDIEAIRNAPDKAAFLPAFIEATTTPEAAMELFDSMDDTAVDVLLRHAFKTELAQGFMDAVDSAPTTLSTKTANPLPDSDMFFVKDQDGFVEDYTNDPDPTIPHAPPSIGDLIEHARIEAGLNPERLGTKNAGRHHSRVPLFSDAAWTSAAASNIPIFGRTNDARLREQGGWKQSGWFRYGRLPSKVFKADRLRKAAVASAESTAKNFSRQVKKFINAAIDPDVAVNFVNDALGSTRNWSDQDVVKQLDATRKAANKVLRNQFLSDYAQVRTMRANGLTTQADALHNQLVSQLNTDVAATRATMDAGIQADSDQRWQDAKDRQAAALAAILAADPEFYTTLVKFRADIDALSSEIAADPSTSDDLRAVIDREKGLWLHRTYLMHKDPKWVERIKERHPALLPVIADAERFIREELVEEGTKARIYANRQARIANPTVARLPEADAQAQAEHELNTYPGMIEARMNDYLSWGRSGYDAFGSPTYATTSRPAILRHRKDIPAPIRALWGEVKDPRITGAQSLVAAKQRVANKKFIREFTADGLYDPTDPGKPFFLVRKEDVGKVPGTANWEPVLSEGTDNEASPLAGLYGPPAVYDAIHDIFDPTTQERMLRFASKATGYAMSTKTTLSPKSWVRNFVSNILIVIGNGNFTRPSTLRHIIAAVKTIGNDLANTGNAATRDLIADLIARGVIHDNQVVGLLRELHDSLSADMDIEQLMSTVTGRAQRLTDKVARAGRVTLEKAGDFYQAQDDFWKMVSYLGELKTLEGIYAAELSAAASDPVALAALEEKMKQEAADTVAQTMPTYSHVPEVLKRFRRSSLGVLFAPYVSWPAEILRISYNIPALAFKDIRSGNAARASRGYWRLTHFAAAQGLASMIPWAMVALAQAAVKSLDDDDEENPWWENMARRVAAQPTPEEERAFRDHLPEWSRNASLLFFGKDEKGAWRYMDISYTDPFDYWKRVSRSAWLASTTEGVTGWDAVGSTMWDTVGEIVKPFTGSQLLAGSVLEAVSGKAPGQYEGAPTVRTYAVGDELGDLVKGAVSGTNERDSGNLVNGMLHVIEQSLVPGAVQTAQNIVKGSLGVVEGGKVYDVSDEVINTTLGIKINTLDPLESDMFKFRAAAKQYGDAAKNVRDRTFIDAGTAGGADIASAYNETMERQKRALADTRRQVLSLRKLGYKDAQIMTSLEAANFNKAAIGQIMTNQFKKTVPTISTVKKSLMSPGAKGQDRTGEMSKAFKEYPDNQPLLSND